MYRFIILSLLAALFMSDAASAEDAHETPAHILAAGARALSHLGSPSAWTHHLLTNVKTTALGCRLLDGLPLRNAIEVYQLELTFDEEQYRVQVSADGSMTQLCDERLPGLGAGLLVSARLAGGDSDGDTFVDGGDDCPAIAGVAGADQKGCPQPALGDRDGDGTSDSIDFCPQQAGAAVTDGCALLQDADGDGVPDSEDICAYDFGIIRVDFALGCPADGSGSSTRRRGATEICTLDGAEIPLYERGSDSASVIGLVDADSGGEVLGRDAGQAWYQLGSGWVAAWEQRLQGACYNIPLVHATPGAATGCFLRPHSNVVNVRQAPRGKQVRQIPPNQVYVALGRNFAGDWLFYRQGWVSLSVLELSGSCDELPILDPEKVGSGTISFCPPGYAGVLPPRIDVGQANARVASQTFANRLRAQPQITSEQIGEIAPGSVLDAVLDGPACDGAFVWWQVEVLGQIGWTVESDLNANYYYLEPVAAAQASSPTSSNAVFPRAPAEQPLPTTFQRISSANAAKLDTIMLLPSEKPLMLAWSLRESQLAVLHADHAIEIYSYPAFDLVLSSEALLESPPPTAIAFRPDERFLALGTADGRVYLVDLTSGDLVATDVLPQQHRSPVRALAWSRDGNWLAAASTAVPSQIAGKQHTLKLWQIHGPQAAITADAQLEYGFPYPLVDLSFSEDGRWLAVTGEDSAKARAGLWIYDTADYELRFSKALVSRRGTGLLRASPAAALGDFVYSNGDSLYHLDIDSGQDIRFYHLAGAVFPQLAIRRQIIQGDEILFALSSKDADGSGQLHLFNALNSHSPSASLQLDAASLVFSPDGRILAVASREDDRILLLGVAER